MDSSTYELDTLDVPPLTPTSKEVLSQAVKASFSGFTQERISRHFPHDPTLWSEWEVNHWLDWCQAEFSLDGLGSDLRGLQGSELCGLDRDTFLSLMSDGTAGEILWEHLETMRRENEPECDLSLAAYTASTYCQLHFNKEIYSDCVQDHPDKHCYHGDYDHSERSQLHSLDTVSVQHGDIYLVKTEETNRRGPGGITDLDLDVAHGDDSDHVTSLSWTAPLQEIDPLLEETMSEDVFTLPQQHRSFKEYVGNKTNLGRAVIPAAILAGYTGKHWAEEIQHCRPIHPSIPPSIHPAGADGDCLNRKWSHPAVAVPPGTPDGPQLSVLYQLDRRWMGVQAHRP
ncbi:hypothetical protein INR49_002680 [Caranx melampygus]|nr:hypothetical protein INR49_002680 [Caranx melampygus]